MKNFLPKKFIILLSFCLFALAGCIDVNGNSSENSSAGTTAADFEKIISFGEWLYKGGSQPQIKYYIEKEVGKGDILFSAVMTMYNNDELIGINSFKTTLQENINIDYYVISPDKNKAVTKIELKDIYLDDRKYSISRTFFIKAE